MFQTKCVGQYVPWLNLVKSSSIYSETLHLICIGRAVNRSHQVQMPQLVLAAACAVTRGLLLPTALGMQRKVQHEKIPHDIHSVLWR